MRYVTYILFLHSMVIHILQNSPQQYFRRQKGVCVLVIFLPFVSILFRVVSIFLASWKFNLYWFRESCMASALLPIVLFTPFCMIWNLEGFFVLHEIAACVHEWNMKYFFVSLLLFVLITIFLPFTNCEGCVRLDWILKGKYNMQ